MSTRNTVSGRPPLIAGATRRRLLAGAGGGLLLSQAGRAGAQAQRPAVEPAPGIPRQPVRLIVGYATGTSPDTSARLLARKLEETWTAGVVVENRPGAGGSIAMTAVGTSAPDGHTFLWGTVGEMAISPAINRKLPYDPARLVPIKHISSGEVVFTTGSQVPARNVTEFLKWSEGRSPLLIGTFGPGSPHHLLALLFERHSGRKVEPVHYKAVADVASDLANGNIHATFATILLSRTWQQAGRATVLGIPGSTPSIVMPELQTFRDAGLERVVIPSWTGLFGPPGLPEPIAVRAHAAFGAALRNSDVARQMREQQGLRVFDNPYGSFAPRVAEDRARLVELADSLQLRVE